MKKETKLKLLLALLSWAISIVLVFLVIFPIYKRDISYPFYVSNVIFFLVFFHFTRYIFLFRHVIFSRVLAIKLIIIFLALPIIIWLMSGLQEFQIYLDEVGLQNILAHLPHINQGEMSKYIKTEMLFFGVGAIIATIVLPFRMLVSIWRVRNTNEV